MYAQNAPSVALSSSLIEFASFRSSAAKGIEKITALAASAPECLVSIVGWSLTASIEHRGWQTLRDNFLNCEPESPATDAGRLYFPPDDAHRPGPCMITPTKKRENSHNDIVPKHESGRQRFERITKARTSRTNYEKSSTGHLRHHVRSVIFVWFPP